MTQRAPPRSAPLAPIPLTELFVKTEFVIVRESAKIPPPPIVDAGAATELPEKSQESIVALEQ
jgi:hypothetical protein